VVPIYTPRKEAELLAIRALLEAEEIPFYVHNDHFGAVYPGLPMAGFNARRVMVPEAHAERAREILEGVLGPSESSPAQEAAPAGSGSREREPGESWAERLREGLVRLAQRLRPDRRTRRPPLAVVPGGRDEQPPGRRRGTG